MEAQDGNCSHFKFPYFSVESNSLECEYVEYELRLKYFEVLVMCQMQLWHLVPFVLCWRRKLLLAKVLKFLLLRKKKFQILPNSQQLPVAVLSHKRHFIFQNFLSFYWTILLLLFIDSMQAVCLPFIQSCLFRSCG